METFKSLRGDRFNMKEILSEDVKITEELKEIVIARIEAQMSSDLKLVIGGNGEAMGKCQLIEHIKKGDEIGRQIVKNHFSFMKAIASGELGKAISAV